MHVLHTPRSQITCDLMEQSVYDAMYDISAPNTTQTATGMHPQRLAMLDNSVNLATNEYFNGNGKSHVATFFAINSVFPS